MKKLPYQIQEVKMVRCDACPELHPMDECEIVTVQFVKGKDCKLNLNPQTELSGVEEAAFYRKAHKTELIDAPVVDEPQKVLKVGHGDLVVELTEQELTRMPKPKNIIPTGLMSMMIDPGNPQFEEKGNKDVRRI